MKKLSEKEAIALLKKYSKDKGSFDKVLKHSKAVRRIALRIAKQIPNVDKHFISIASLLHDIGRFDCWKKDVIKHGIKGADILRKEGFPKYALVAERHLGAGISKEDIKEQGLELPLNDYFPITKEEKIVTHADNLVEKGKEISMERAIQRYEKELGKKVASKIRRLGAEIEKLRNKSC